MKEKRDHNFFERWARRNGMSPVMRVTDVKVNGQPVGDILVADSGVLILGMEYPPMEGSEHGMFSFFRTGFAIDRPGDKTWLATYCDYAPDAFSEYSPDSRQQQRIEEAISYAAKAIEQTQEVKLYERGPRIN